MSQVREKVYASPDELERDRAEASDHGWRVVSIQPQPDGTTRVVYEHRPDDPGTAPPVGAVPGAPQPIVSTLPDSVHSLDIPGIFLTLPEGDLHEGIGAAAAVAGELAASGYLAGAQGRFVLVPGASPGDLEDVLQIARGVLSRRRAPALVIALFGDLATWDVTWANLPNAAVAQVKAVVAEVDTIRRMVAD